MKTVLYLMAVGLVASLCAGQMRMYDVSGSTQAGNGTPTGNANLALVSASTVFQTISDGSGKFAFKDVPAGDYELQAMAAGTRRSIQNLRVPDVSLDDVEVTLRFAMSEPNPLQALPRYNSLPDASVSKIEGAITRARRKPLSGVRVTLVNATTHEQFVSWAGSDGDFVTPVLTPGRYTVFAAHPGYSTATISDIWDVPGKSVYLVMQLDVIGAMYQ